MSAKKQQPRRVRVELTVWEAENLLHAIGNSLDGDEDDLRALFTHGGQTSAAFRAYHKLQRAYVQLTTGSDRSPAPEAPDA